MQKLNIGVEAARKKIQQYCAYQERCHSEVKEKLFEMGLRTAEVENLLAELIQENFLNEERFAAAFSRGKFRMKQWGRVKIKHELKKRRVSDYCIKKGLREINEEDYQATLDHLATKKAVALKGNIFRKRSGLNTYLLQKGYEQSLVAEIVKKLFK